MTAVSDSRARSSSSSAFSSSDSSSGESRCHWACLRYSAAVASCSCNAVGGPLTTGTSVAAIFASTLAARGTGLGERAVRARGTSRSRISRASASWRTVSTASYLPPYVLQGARLTVVHRRVRASAAGRRTALGRHPEGERVADDVLAQLGQRAGDPLQVVTGRMLAGAHPDGVREAPGALEFRGGRSIRAGSADQTASAADDHVQAGRVQLVHPVHQGGQRERLAQPAGAAAGDGHWTRRAAARSAPPGPPGWTSGAGRGSPRAPRSAVV